MPDNQYNIQWFPGHMAKTRRKITESLKLVDGVVELTDARIPESSRNPELRQLVGDKPRIILLNKSDAAEEAQNKLWVQEYAGQGLMALPVDCRSGHGLDKFTPAVRTLLKERLERRAARGMSGMGLRLMVVGIPNVGKSSFINRMARGTRAKVADRPGVTRGNQWFSIGKGLELLDTPGVLWPKFDDPQVGLRLAYTGAVKDDILDVEGLAASLLCALSASHAECITRRYKIEDPHGMSGDELLAEIARRRGMLIAGGDTDTRRAATTVLDEFRGGMLGRITLEQCSGK